MYRLPESTFSWEPVEIRGDPIDILIESQQAPDANYVDFNAPVLSTQPERREWISQSLVHSEESEQIKPDDLSVECFLDPNLVRDFECVICLNFAKDAVTCLFCRASICSGLCIRMYEETTRTQFITCPHCRKDLKLVPRPQHGKKSMEILENLKCICYFEPFCKKIMPSKYYKDHVRRCEFNIDNCQSCQVNRHDSNHHLKVCMAPNPKETNELSSLKRELDRLKRKLFKQISSTEEKEAKISELSSKLEKSEKLNEDKDKKIKELEDQLQLIKKPRLFATSNNIKSVKDHEGKFTKFIIRFGDKVFRIADIPLNAPGIVLRSKIEEELGQRVGPIMRFDHTVIKDDQILKKHQLCYKPTQLVVLPCDRPVEDGRSLQIEVTGRGDIV